MRASADSAHTLRKELYSPATILFTSCLHLDRMSVSEGRR